MKKIFIILYLVCSLFTISCSDFLEEVPFSEANNTYYETTEGIDAAVYSVYEKLRWPYGGERFYTYALFGTDMFMTATGTHGNAWDQYQATALNSTNSMLYQMWGLWYQAISTCNTGLYYIKDMKAQSEWKNQRTAEFRFFRAYYLFELMQQFGAIPMPLEPVLGPITYIKRTPVKDVYEQIINDLLFCTDKDYLPVTAERGVITIGTARHLLAKVYLSRGSAISPETRTIRGTQATDLSDAARYAELVINSKTYQLENNFSDIFLLTNKDSKEVIMTVNFTKDEMWNGSGNQMHLYSTGSYQNQPGMIRDIANGRAWSRIRQTFWVMKDRNLHGGLFDYTNDSRGEKSFKSIWYSNNKNSISKWTPIKDGATTLWTPSPELLNQPKFNLGDPCIIIRPLYLKGTPLSQGGFQTRQDSLVVFGSQNHSLWSMERLQAVSDFWPIITKWANNDLPDVNYTAGHRNFNIFRLGETHLIAAEAYGRQSKYSEAAEHLTEIRKRAAYKAGEWRSNLNVINGTGEILKTATTSSMTVSSTELSTLTSDQFINLILDERGRELIGEENRWNELNRCEKLIERFEAYNGIGGKKKNIKPHHILRPIPQNHIDRLDPAGAIEVEQNPGWY